MTSNRRYWIGVACAEHVRRGRAGGFMQLCHGKAAPLRRLKEGDLFAYYSPVVKFGGKDRLQAFTAAGKVWDPEPYQADGGDGVCAFRRDVAWFESEEAPIAPLLEGLSFTKGVKNWGYSFRYGLLEIAEEDMDLILQATRAKVLAGA